MSVFVRSLLMLAVALPWAARAEGKLGNEVLAARHFNVLQGKRVGLLTNPSGVNRHLESTIEVLRAAAPLTAINFYAFEALKRVAGRDLLAEAVKASRGFGMFDKVNGTDATRKALQAGTSTAELVASWKAGDEAFRKARRKYLLY
jgi:uncharacterized protein YbbC (DUF1343 family)